MLRSMMEGHGWLNIRVVYDAVLGWTVEAIGGNCGLVVREGVALRLVKYLAALNGGLRDVSRLP